MVSWLLSALAALGLLGSTAPRVDSSGHSPSTQSPSVTPAPSPQDCRTDGQTGPPVPCGN